MKVDQRIEDVIQTVLKKGSKDLITPWGFEEKKKSADESQIDWSHGSRVTRCRQRDWRDLGSPLNLV